MAGARPNFMKIAPLVEEIRKGGWAEPFIIHTGQHYDAAMSRAFFDDLGIPKPDVNLEVGSGSHALQTGEIMKRIEPVFEAHRPDIVVVVGDVNSTMAATLVAVKMGIRTAHVEAGLRSFDRTMPEEINRMVTDAVADYLFTSEPSGGVNLAKEGVPPEKVFHVGNVMIDTLIRQQERAAASPILDRLGLEAGAFALLTLHRPANVDRPDAFRAIFSALFRVQRHLPILFPIHPRTRRRITELGMGSVLAELGGGKSWHTLADEFESGTGGNRGLRFIDPVGYHDFLRLMTASRLVLTDSGGIQEETTFLGIPCVTMRENTERPITLEVGTNVLVGKDPDAIVAASERAIHGRTPERGVPDLWDGQAARRIVDILHAELGQEG